MRRHINNPYICEVSYKVLKRVLKTEKRKQIILLMRIILSLFKVEYGPQTIEEDFMELMLEAITKNIGNTKLCKSACKIFVFSMIDNR